MTQTKKIPRKAQEAVVQAMNHVADNYTFVAWSPKEMRAKWRKRTLNQIIQEKTLNRLFPCVDLGAVAASYLAEQNIPADFVVLTEPKSVKRFRAGLSRKLHLDAYISVPANSDLYCFGLGCGDISIITPAFTENGTREYTTRFIGQDKEGNEPASQDLEKIEDWRREPIIHLRGKDVQRLSDMAPLDWLWTGANLTSVPFGISPNELKTERKVSGGQSYADTNQKDYDPKADMDWSCEWTARNSVQDIFPGLKPLTYR